MYILRDENGLIKSKVNEIYYHDDEVDKDGNSLAGKYLGECYSGGDWEHIEEDPNAPGYSQALIDEYKRKLEKTGEYSFESTSSYKEKRSNEYLKKGITFDKLTELMWEYLVSIGSTNSEMDAIETLRQEVKIKNPKEQ